MRFLKTIFLVTTALMLIIVIVVGTSSNIIKKKPRRSAQSKMFERFYLKRASHVLSPSAVVSASTSIPSTTTIPPTTTTHTHPLRTTIDTVHAIKKDVWASLANCESTMNQRATSKSGKHLGYFQFSMDTWRSVGGPGDPRDHDYETQLRYAKILQAKSGWDQWPGCSIKLGLR